MVIRVSGDGNYYLSNTEFVIMFDKFKEESATVNLYRRSEFIGLIDKRVFFEVLDEAKRQNADL